MALLDFFRKPPVPIGPPTVAKRTRISQDENPSTYAVPLISSPPSPEETWRTLNLDDKTLDTLSPAELLKLLPDLSPEISDALYLYLRMCNPGYDLAVTWPNSDRPHTAGITALETFFNKLEEYHGSFNIIVGKLFIGQFLRGAALAELVLHNHREPVDMATPDPHSINFMPIQDPIRGQIYQPGQWQDGVFIPLDMPTIKYIPVDPLYGEPYGRPLVNPALFSSLFLLSLLHDVKRVIQQQGYKRIDVTVKMEQLAASMPATDRTNPKAVQEWTNAVIDEVKDVYTSLEPDDAYIHTDVIELNNPVGTADADSLNAIGELIRGLERMAARGLKTMPLLMGSNESVTETHAKYQWALQSTQIRSMQHLIETLLNRLLTLALTAQGINATVKLTFAALAPDRLYDEQVRAMEIANAREEYAAGWISQDEAANNVVGHDAEEEEPRNTFQGFLDDEEETEEETEEEDDRSKSMHQMSRSSNGRVLVRM